MCLKCATDQGLQRCSLGSSPQDTCGAMCSRQFSMSLLSEECDLLSKYTGSMIVSVLRPPRARLARRIVWLHILSGGAAAFVSTCSGAEILRKLPSGCEACMRSCPRRCAPVFHSLIDLSLLAVRTAGPLPTTATQSILLLCKLLPTTGSLSAPAKGHHGSQGCQTINVPPPRAGVN